MTYEYKLDNFITTPNSDDNRIIILDKNSNFRYSIITDLSHWFVKNNCVVVKITNKNDIMLSFESREVAYLALDKLNDVRKQLIQVDTSNTWYSYKALISQTDENAPTEVILNQEDDNFLSGLTWSRITGGTYYITKTGAFLINKTLPISEAYTDIDGNYYTINRLNNNTMELKTYNTDDTNVLSDNILNSRYINIEIKI